MAEQTIRIGTRGSKLARWQAQFARQQLVSMGVECEIVIIKTQGDRIQHLSFDKMEGKGFFTKEIEEALLRNEIDLAVHSMKDLPTTHPEGLAIAAVSYRADPADWLVIRKDRALPGQTLQLPGQAVVGTSSARRKAQLLDLRPDVEIRDIRGNVPTRLAKLRQGPYDAILLAAAGLSRLEINLSEFEVVRLNPREFVPAPAQGVLAFQTRTDDLPVRRIVRRIHQGEVAERTNVERRVLQLFGGGCHMPLGVYCECDSSGNFHVWAAQADEWQGPLRRAQISSSTRYQLPERILEALKA